MVDALLAPKTSADNGGAAADAAEGCGWSSAASAASDDGWAFDMIALVDDIVLVILCVGEFYSVLFRIPLQCLRFDTVNPLKCCWLGCSLAQRRDALNTELRKIFHQWVFSLDFYAKCPLSNTRKSFECFLRRSVAECDKKR